MSEHIQTATPEPAVYTLGFMIEYVDDRGESIPAYFSLLVGSGRMLMHSLRASFQVNWLGYASSNERPPAIHVFSDIENFRRFASMVEAFVPHYSEDVWAFEKYVPGLAVSFIIVDATQFDLLTTIEE